MQDNSEPQKTKWYQKNSSLIISFLLVGPFVLPLVWFNPRFSKNTKIIITVIIVALTALLTLLLAKSLCSITNYYQELNNL